MSYVRMSMNFYTSGLYIIIMNLHYITKEMHNKFWLAGGYFLLIYSGQGHKPGALIQNRWLIGARIKPESTIERYLLLV